MTVFKKTLKNVKGTWDIERQRAREKTGKKGKEKNGDRKERKKKDKALNFYFARAKCFLRFCSLFQKLFLTFSILSVVRSGSDKIL